MVNVFEPMRLGLLLFVCLVMVRPMRTLFHMPIDPACRMARIALSEKGLVTRFREVQPWTENPQFIAHNPAATIPVLIDEPPTGGEHSISPISAIFEYLDDAYGSPSLYPGTSAGRAETRRLVHWFTDKFEADVTVLTVRERIDKRLRRAGQPDYDKLKAGLNALSWHMDYAAWLLEQRNWLAGEKPTAADFAAAAQLSCLDYIDAVPWEKFTAVKDWYARIKSRPGFQPLLADRIEGLPPPPHYDDVDF